MAERIGLEAHFDDDAWRRGTDAYMKRVDDMNGATGRIAGEIGKSFTNLGKVIAGATTAMVTAIGGVVAFGAKELAGWTAEGIQGAIDLEQRIADIGSVLGKTGQEVGPLGDLIDELALDPKLVVGADEAADAIENLARNGLNMDQILDGAARSVVLLANATGGSFATSADVATDMLGQFGLGVEDLGKAVDIAQGVINNSKFTIDDWRLALAQGGGVAGALGVEIEDFAAAIAGTSHLFGSGSDAGTSFKTMLQRLVPQSNEAADEMRRLGLFTGLTGAEFDKAQTKLLDLDTQIAALDPTAKNYQERLRKLQKEKRDLTAEMVKGGSAFFDEEGNMRSMSEISGALQQAFGGLSEAQRTEALTTIFGSDAMRAAVGLMDLGAEGLSGVRDEVVKLGSAEQAAATRMDTLNAQLSILGDQWEAIQRKSGSQFTDTLKDIVKWLNELTANIGDRVVALFGNLAELMDVLWQRAQPILDKFIPVFIDNLEALANYLIEVASGGENTTQWLDRMSPGLRSVVEGVQKGWEAFQRFREILGNVIERVQSFLQPVTDFIAKHVELQDVLMAAGLAVGAFLAPLALAIAKMAAVGAAATAAVALIRTAWETDFGGIRTFLGATWEQISGIFETGVAIVQEVWGRLTSAVSGNGEVLTNLLTLPWENFKTYLTAALGVIQNVLDIVLAAIQGDWGRVWQEMKDTFQLVWDAIKEVFTRTWDALSAAIETYLPPFLAKLKEWGAALWNWIVEVTPVVLTKLGEWAGALWDWISTNAPRWAETLQSWATAAWEWITKVTPQAVDKLQEWGSALWGWITQNAPTWYEKLKTWAEAAWKWITETAIPTAKEKLVEWGTALWTWITDNAPQWLDKLQTWAQAAWQWIVDVTPEVVGKLAEWGEALWTWVTDNAATWGEKFAGWAQAAWQWIVDVTPTVVEKLREWGEALWTWVTDNAPEWGKKFDAWAEETWKWISEKAAPDMEKKLIEWRDAMFTWLDEQVPQLAVKLVQWATAFVTWVGEAIPKMITALGDLSIALINWITSDKPTEGKGSILEGLKTWVEALWRWVMTDLWPVLEPELTKLKDAMIIALGNIGAAILETAKGIGTAIIDGTINGINEKWDALTTKMTEMATGALNAAKSALGIQSPSKETEEFGKLTVEGFEQGITNNIRLALDAATNLTRDFLRKFDIILEQLPKVSKDSMVQFVQMFDQGMTVALNRAQADAQDFLRKFDIILNRLPAIARESMGPFVREMQAGFQTLTAGVQTFVNQFVSQLQMLSSRAAAAFQQVMAAAQTNLDVGRFRTIGENLVNGLIAGIDARIGAAQAKVQELINLAAQAAAQTAQIASPSKVFQRLGDYVGLGFGLGVEDTFATVIDTVGNAMRLMASVVQEQAQRIANSLRQILADINLANKAAVSLAPIQTQMPAVAATTPTKEQLWKQQQDAAWAYKQTLMATDMVQAEDGSWVQKSFYSAGQAAAQGIASGLASGAKAAADQAAALARAMTSSATKALGVASPSEVFRVIGDRVGEGLEMGLRESFTSVIHTLETMLNRLTDTVLRQAQLISNALYQTMQAVAATTRQAIQPASTQLVRTEDANWISQVSSLFAAQRAAAVPVYGPTTKQININNHIYNQFDAAQLRYEIERTVREML